MKLKRNKMKSRPTNSSFAKPYLQTNPSFAKRAVSATATMMLLIISLTLINSCSVTKNTANIEKISFGNGGGFTGNITEYTLSKDGEITKNESLTNEKTVIKTIKKKELVEIYNQLTELKYHTYKFNYPGNTYSFLKIIEGDNEYYISWGEPTKKVNEEIELFYTKLINLIK